MSFSRKLIALLLLVIWTPVVSHCLIEDAMGMEDACCESSGSESDHSGCMNCVSVEKGQARSEVTVLPAPIMVELDTDFFQPFLPVHHQSEDISAPASCVDDTPPVPPAELILQASIAQPVRGPSMVG